MLIFPAIDLRAGQVVRLHQGDYGQQTTYGLDALELAQACADAGARWLHVVDLDGARDGVSPHRPLIARIAGQTPLNVQSGGGVRNHADFRALLDAGVRRVVVGSTYLRQPQEVARWIAEAGTDAVCLALDVREHTAGSGRWQVQMAGWRESSGQDLLQTLDAALTQGARHFLVTDISRDGTLAGPNLELYQQLLSRFPQAWLQASGGVSTLADLRDLSALGVHAAVVGKALLERRFTLAQALDQELNP